MLKSILAVLRFFVFWMILFLLDRAIFLLFFARKLEKPPVEIFEAFIHGLRLDASAAMYLSAIPLVLFILVWYFPQLKIPQVVKKIYIYCVILIISLISVINLNIYREWGSKVSYKALEVAISSPKEAFASSSSSPLLSSAGIVILIIASGIWLSSVIIQFETPHYRTSSWAKAALSSLLILLDILIIRGGWQLAPVNQSMAYYSNSPLLNHAAVNTHWNLLHDWLKHRKISKNPYQYFPSAQAKQIVNGLYAGKNGPGPSILTSQRPNIVLIILESFTADVVGSLGGEQGITPGIDRLADKGILFTNIYASADRTDKGLIAVLSGFPSQAIRSIIKENNKHEKLPSIAADLKRRGYQNSFYYGGESEFSNFKSYILSHGYDHLTDAEVFEQSDKNSKWGAHDNILFNRVLSDLPKQREPFFSTILTLSNHEPFELPGTLKFGDATVEDKFRSTAFFTDSVLYDFVSKAQKEPWYKNTLFLVVADHGHRLPLNKHESFDPGRYRIPLLLFGEVIRPEFRGQKISKIGSQTDIPNTLLSQVGLPATTYEWSSNLFNAAKEFAFFDWDNGFGLVTPGQSITFDNVGRNVIYQKNKDYSNNDSLLNIGKAYMQRVFETYMTY